jgi:hypothetical protein
MARDKVKVAAYYVKNRDAILAKQAAYYAANKENKAPKHAEYRAKNKAQITAKRQAFRAANKELIKEKCAAKYAENRAAVIADRKAYYAKNRDAALARMKAYRAANKLKIAKTQAAYAKRNRARIAVRQTRRYAVDPDFKLRHVLRRRMRAVLRAAKVAKTYHRHVDLLGCTVEELRVHIEKQFAPWMTWENHGFRTWHIDHIKPLTSFDLTDPAQVSRACHYTNLRPLYWRENIRKGARAA